jgi:putative acetyltransferase
MPRPPGRAHPASGRRWWFRAPLPLRGSLLLAVWSNLLRFVAKDGTSVRRNWRPLLRNSCLLQGRLPEGGQRPLAVYLFGIMPDGTPANVELWINAEDPAQPEILTLLKDGEEHSARLYPAESNHHLALVALRAPNVRFLVARDGGGRALGTGAIVLHDTWAELKRMWVMSEARGRGVSKAILAALEATARKQNVRCLRLETGVESLAALGLYTQAGFKHRGPFGDYKADPLSVFMQKDLCETATINH